MTSLSTTFHECLTNAKLIFNSRSPRKARKRAQAQTSAPADVQVLEARVVMSAAAVAIAPPVHVEAAAAHPTVLAANANSTSPIAQPGQSSAIVGNAIVSTANIAIQAEHSTVAPAGSASSNTLMYQYSVVSIHNTTNATVSFSLDFGGPSKVFSLSAGQENDYWVSGLNRTATISFDKSFAAGYQNQTYTLPSSNVTFPNAFYLVAPTPTFDQGRAYAFEGVTNGVQLYKTINAPSTLTLNETSSSTAKLTWDSVDSAQGYRVYWWNGQTAVLLGTYGAGVTSLNLTHVPHGVNYLYVQAYNGGMSANSVWVSVKMI